MTRRTVRAAEVDRWAVLTHVAMVVALGVVVARLTVTDVVRDAWAVAPGGQPPTGPGPASGLLFDLLAAVPALLVLARRAVDPDYRLTVRWSHWLLLAVVGWMAASVGWADDRFAAVASAGGFAGAACLLWAASQLCRSWDAVRVVCGVALGLLLALAVRTVSYDFEELSDLRQYWAEHRTEFLQQRGWAADSFQARQFELKLRTGEQSAFFASANTLAAAGVLLAFAAAGLGVQRAMDDRDPRWLMVTAATVAAAARVLYVARSKTSIATPVLGVGLVAVWWFGRQWVWGTRGARRAGFEVRPVGGGTAAGSGAPPGRPAGVHRDAHRRHRVAFAGGSGVVATAVLFVAAWGAAHHGLFPGHFSNSLDFRWKYWTASAGVWRDHPLVGVGWANFGEHYLAHRVPDAVEEIRDPHNFLVRFAAELGTVGLVLAVGWLGRLAWELTRPGDADGVPGRRPLHVGLVGWAAAAGLVLNRAVAGEWTGDVIDGLLLSAKAALLPLAVVLGGIGGAMRSPQGTAADDRRGPWVFATLVVGLGLFLVHNLIDFGLGEAGALAAFMLLAGAASGVSPVDGPTPVNGPGPAGRGWAIGGLTVAFAAWVAVAGGIAVPIAIAGSRASAADATIVAARADDPRAVVTAYRRVAAGYASAAAAVPYDADLWTRAARAAYQGGDLTDAAAWADRAVAADPQSIEARLTAADVKLFVHDGPAVRAAYDAVIRLNPTDVAARVRYAEALDRLGDPAAAAVQVRAALANNAALPPLEPRRLSSTDVAALTARASR